MILNLKSALLYIDEACHRTFIVLSRLIYCLPINFLINGKGGNEREKGRDGDRDIY